MRLSGGDVDGLLRVTREIAAHDQAEPFCVAAIDLLTNVVRADQAGYYEYRVRANHHHRGTYEAGTLFNVKQPGVEPPWSDCVRDAWWEWPLNDFRNSHRKRALRFSDGFASANERRRNPWYQIVMRPSGVAHEIDVWLPAPDGTVRGFFFVREDGRRDFSERDRTFLTILRPHLAAMRSLWQQRHLPPGLTRREAELLELVRVGLSNREIAERLVISPETVRKHLWNLFKKIGVHNRTAAAAYGSTATRLG